MSPLLRFAAGAIRIETVRTKERLGESHFVLMFLRQITAQSAGAVRGFASSSVRRISLESPTYAGLYYHSIDAIPHSYSLSFLPTPAPSLDFSPSTIGTLSNVDNSAQPGIPPNLLPRNFNDNDDFKTLLHEVLQGCIEGDMGIGTMAKIRVDGYMSVQGPIAFSQSSRELTL